MKSSQPVSLQWVRLFTYAGISLVVALSHSIGGVVYDLSSDFSTNANPNGVWSYGYVTDIGAPFQPVSVARNDEVSQNGVPIQSWSISGFRSPDFHFNGTTNTATSDGGVFPP